MEKVRNSIEVISKLVKDENLTPGVRKSLDDLYSELERIRVCRQLGLGVRWTQARKIAVGLINNQNQENSAITELLHGIGIPGIPRRNPKI